MVLSTFHPAVQRWFERRFAAPTDAQAQAWPAIAAGRHTLVAAPTGSGKTLTAFLAAIDALLRRGLAAGGALPDETAVVYVSPLKALSNDIRANLEAPLAGIRAELAELGLPDVEIRAAVRTGDTPQRERQQGLRRPPHIIVTTPESLYVLMGSASGRKLLGTVRTVIVDEIHALAANKRGSHLALTLERLQALCAAPLQRIALSATQKPIADVAAFLIGAGEAERGCTVIDIGYRKQRDLALELPPTPLSAVMSGDQWQQVYTRVAALVQQHRTTLVFVNTRRLAERAARHLTELLGREVVATHHGSLSREARHTAEQKLKAGELKVLVATASLELGLDIGDVDLVCQLGSPRAIATLLQRAGRAGHAVGGTPKARLFPQTRDELVECAALLDAVAQGELDALRVPPAPLDVLAQQIVAEVASQHWNEDALFALFTRAGPYATLPRERFDALLAMLAEGYTTRHGPRGAYVHRDAVKQELRARRGARLTALTSGGTIPETGDFAVLLEPQAERVGTINEDFAIESMAGDVFQLGNASYRILKVEAGTVRVEDAKGAAPTIPFWLGEAPGRSDELSAAVSRLRADVAAALALAEGGEAAALQRLQAIPGVGPEAARQIVDYAAATRRALGVLPTHRQLVLERFFDPSGGMQLVLHAPLGSRINRAWGLALRKRFCRQFNFELQAAATEDAIVLSLSTSHSFELGEVMRYLNSKTAQDVLVQALLDAPLFTARWRWNATNALALPRFAGGRKVAPQLQRMKSEDLLAAVFPDQVACAENLSGPREVPDHPLVAQTLHDCLHEAMDCPGWLQVLRALETGQVTFAALDLPAPSPLAVEALQARPYAFLDDAPLEERRTRAVINRRYGEVEDSDDMGALDGEAIAAVRAEAWPEPRSADEMHEALLALGAITATEAAAHEGWPGWLQELARGQRATQLGVLWVVAERLNTTRGLYPEHAPQPAIKPLDGTGTAPEDALRDLLRCRLGALGPTPARMLAMQLALPLADVLAALAVLRREGTVFEGRITPGLAEPEWCERHLLARIHRYTLKRLRREIEPVEPRDFMRFLFDWLHVGADSRFSGPDALPAVLAQLEGFEAPAALWEAELLPARLRDYSPAWLDELCTAGRVRWTRLRPAVASVEATSAAAPRGAPAGRGSLRSAPIVLLPRRAQPVWAGVAAAASPDTDSTQPLASRSQRVVDWLGQQGASFFDELMDGCRLLQSEAEDALADLVVRGRASCDSFAGLRALLVPPAKRATLPRGRRRLTLSSIEDAGRWTLQRAPEAGPLPAETLEHLAHTLLKRWGVVCWRLLEREAAWLPPWRELVRVYRRLEARGEVRGGRFIAGLSGEQFALPEALTALRQVRRERDERGDDGTPPNAPLICLAAADPANLLGSVLVGPRVPRIAGNRVLYRDGLAIAVHVGGKSELLMPLDAETERAALRLLVLDPAVRHQAHEGLAGLAANLAAGAARPPQSPPAAAINPNAGAAAD